MLILPLLSEVLGNIYIVIISFPLCDFKNFGNSVSFFNKSNFYITKKCRANVSISEKRKELLR